MGISPKKLALSVTVALALSFLLASNAKSSAEQALNTLTMRHVNHDAVSLPPEMPQEALSVTKVAEAAEKPKEAPRPLPDRKEAPASQGELMAHWAAVMDELGTQHKTTLLRMIRCESSGKEKVDILDTNGKRSRGLLQFQDTTWAWLSKEAGIKGSPLVGRDAIRVADYALGKGHGPHWSCF